MRNPMRSLDMRETDGSTGTELLDKYAKSETDVF